MKRRLPYLIGGVLSLTAASWCFNTALAYGSLGMAPGFPFEEARANADFYSILVLLFFGFPIFCAVKFFRSISSDG